jgi:hypothetical protein
MILIDLPFVKGQLIRISNSSSLTLDLKLDGHARLGTSSPYAACMGRIESVRVSLIDGEVIK